MGHARGRNVTRGAWAAIEELRSQAGGLALVGVGAPTEDAADGSLYFERDAAGQTVGEWSRVDGAWVQVLGPPPCAVATSSAAIPVADNTDVYIPWDVIREDNAGMLSAADTHVWTIKRAGRYAISAFWRFTSSGNTTGSRQFWIRLNDTFNIEYQNILPPTATAQTSGLLYREQRLSVGDTIKFGARQTSGGTISVEKNDPQGPEASIRWLMP